MKLKNLFLFFISSLLLASCTQAETKHVHVDNNHDHTCDTCGKTNITSHVDNDNDHNCDICGKTNITSHVDENKDHYCDICNTKMTSHFDLDKDHYCDTCHQKISECEDTNKDHYCDVCAKELSTHNDANHDHYCDLCDVLLSQHKDDNHDGFCDICNFDMREEDDPIDEKPTDAPIPEKLDHRAGYEFDKDVRKPTSGTTKIDLYGINDFHGAISTNISLAKMGTYIKDKTRRPNTLFIDSGDTWQGSLESNYNRGKLINDVFSYAKLSARTIGNHDFDWGTNKIYVNTSRTYNGYNVPVLGANIYNFDWDTKTAGDIQLYNLGREYVTYTLDNGLKVGIVGVIGDNQITSIATNLVKKVTFTNHIQKIKEVSDFLRVEKGCDIVIASEHDGYDEEEDSLTLVSPISNKQYVDFVFNGHTHYNESTKVNGVYFAQCGANGDAVGHVTLTYDYAAKKVLTNQTTYTCKETSAIIDEVNEMGVDNNIKQIINKYAEETSELGNKVLSSKFDGYFDKAERMPNLVCEAIFSECQKEGYTVDFTYANDCRAYISKSNKEVTYSDIYKACPFDNLVYIIEAKGQQCVNELTSYSCLYNNNHPTVNTTTTYKIAALDYLAFHTNKYREYDYFPNAVEVTYLKKADGSPYTYRDILEKYLLENPNKSFYADNYTSSQTRFSRPVQGPDDPSKLNYGTEQEPLSVTEALSLGREVCTSHNMYTAQEVYCYGLVSQVGTKTSYGYQGLYISDCDNEILIYSITADVTLLKEDFIYIHGYIKNHNGTIEFATYNSNQYVYLYYHLRLS